MIDLHDELVIALAGRYEIERELGHGGMAVVYLAHDPKNGRRVALKVLRPELANSIATERFLQEIAIAAPLVHPNIVPLHDSGEASGFLYYTMPFVDGETLRQRLEREVQLPIDDALAIARQVAAALDYAHGKGAVHRDIKPDNILLLGDHVLVSDFGLARAITRSASKPLTTQGIVVGTPLYMSPEQCSPGGKLSLQSDIYSLACVVFEMIAGVPPFRGATVDVLMSHHLLSAVPSLCDERRTCPEALDVVVRRALAKIPADRYRSAGDFVRAMDTAMALSATPYQLGGRTAVVPDAVRAHGGGSREAWRARLFARLSAVPGLVRRRGNWIALSLLALAAAAYSVSKMQPRRIFTALNPAMDPARIAFAPFDLIDAPSGEWREWLVEILSRNIDGAGPIQAVPASTVLTGWEKVDRADRVSAQRLATRTGAGIVVFGQLRHRQNRIDLEATVFDFVNQRMVLEAKIAVPSSESVMDLADSLTTIVLHGLSSTRAIAAVRRDSLAWPSLEALKPFLRGEQHFRQNEYPDAEAEYRTAIGRDSSFALAYHGLRRALRVRRGELDEESLRMAIAAGQRNHHLATRDSLLIVADSLLASRRSQIVYDTASQRRIRRHVAALEEAARLYPTDPEVFEELGEARLHNGEYVQAWPAQALDAFTRAIRLDPDYAPPYFHATELALDLHGRDSARAITRAFRARHPNDTRFALLDDVLRELSRSRLPDANRLRGAASNDVMDAAYVLRRWTGPPYASEALRQFVAQDERADSSTRVKARLAWLLELVYHGRVGAAAALMSSLDSSTINPETIVALARLGALPGDRARPLFAEWLAKGDLRSVLAALPWWSAKADTASLSAAAQRFMLAATTAGSPPGTVATAQYGIGAAAFYSRLALRDTNKARLAASRLPDSLCGWRCTPELLDASQLLVTQGDLVASARLLDAHPPTTGAFGMSEVQWHLQRGRIASMRLRGITLDAGQQSAESRRAVYSLGFVIRAWCRADPPLYAMAIEARSRLRALPNSVIPSCEWRP